MFSRLCCLFLIAWLAPGCGGDDDGAAPSTDAAVGEDDAAVVDDADAAPDPDAAPVACDEPIACPDPTELDEASVCGRLFDLENNARVEAPLEVKIYDALEFASNPGATPPLATVDADACGRFAALEVPDPTFGFAMVVVDDDTGAEDLRAPTGVQFPLDGGDTIDDVVAFSLTRATDEDWTSSAGDPFEGATYAETGVIAGIFIDPAGPTLPPFSGSPVSGVSFRVADNTVADDDWYFSDVDAQRTTIDAEQLATAVNGSGLLVGVAAPAPVSGDGGEPDACSWQAHSLAAVPGVVVAAVFETVCE